MFHAMREEVFIKAYLEAHKKYGATSSFVVHMRIATHGAVKESTCHPFELASSDGQTIFAHNGIITEMDEYTSKDVSDTMAFGERVLSNLPDNWMDVDGLSEMIADYIGYSKLVVLTTSKYCDNEMYIINEELGNWDGDIWFSNHSCAPITYVKDYRKDWTPINSKSNDYIKDLSKAHTLYEPSQLVGAVGEELYDITLDCVNKAVTCVVCTGVYKCYCEDTCSTCYELYYYCGCLGDFESLHDLYSNTSVADDYEEVLEAATANVGNSNYTEGWPWSD